MTGWSTDTWLLVGVVLTGVISAGIAGFGVYRQMWRARRDRTWRRLDRLNVPLDGWTANIGVLNPTWAQSPHNGEMTLIPNSTYDAAIRATMPKAVVDRVDKFFADRRLYANKCLSLLSVVKAEVAAVTGVPILDYLESGQGLYLRPHFAESIFCALYANLYLRDHLEFVYDDKKKNGSSPDGHFVISTVEFRWPQGPMSNWIVPIIEHKSGSEPAGAVPAGTDIQTLKNLHERMLTDIGIDGAISDITELENRYQALATEATNLQSEIAHFRAH